MSGKSWNAPVYSMPGMYSLVMRMLYGRGFEDRYKAVSKWIPEKAEVLDLCCGDCLLYTKFLKEKNVHYTGSDFNPQFAAGARRKGIPFIRLDPSKDVIPKTDYLLMMGSLYQFYPEVGKLISKIVSSARKKVIISEPVHNVSNHSNFFIASLGKYLTGATFRFDEKSFSELWKPYSGFMRGIEKIADGRECMVVLDVENKFEK